MTGPGTGQAPYLSVITVQDHRYLCPTRGKWTADGRVCAEPLGADVCRGCFEEQAYLRGVYALTQERLAAVRRMRAVVVLSRYMKRELAGAGVPGWRMAVIPPFVHGLDRGASPERGPCLLFAGRLAASKGVHDAVAAWRASGLDLPLVFVGTGSARAALESEGHEVLGWVDHVRLSRLYRAALAVLMPPRWQEPFGIVGLEALTLGRPVLAWESGGIAEWHPGGPTLAAWGDEAGLARAVVAAVAQGRAEPPGGFEREALMARLLAVYRSVAGSARPGRLGSPRGSDRI
ncbi:MAG: glycosyltransferase [Acidobacteria bacterium]|nr:glycosyltransferase [Acidobacteriota bacterium]